MYFLPIHNNGGVWTVQCFGLPVGFAAFGFGPANTNSKSKPEGLGPQGRCGASGLDPEEGGGSQQLEVAPRQVRQGGDHRRPLPRQEPAANRTADLPLWEA